MRGQVRLRWLWAALPALLVAAALAPWPGVVIQEARADKVISVLCSGVTVPSQCGRFTTGAQEDSADTFTVAAIGTWTAAASLWESLDGGTSRETIATWTTSEAPQRHVKGPVGGGALYGVEVTSVSSGTPTFRVTVSGRAQVQVYAGATYTPTATATHTPTVTPTP